jgi:hypothetical protein
MDNKWLKKAAAGNHSQKRGVGKPKAAVNSTILSVKIFCFLKRLFYTKKTVKKSK